MNDDDQLRRLLPDAVSDVEPDDRIEELRASVRPRPPVVPTVHDPPLVTPPPAIVARGDRRGRLRRHRRRATTRPSPVYAGQPRRPVRAADGHRDRHRDAADLVVRRPSGDTARGYAVYYVGTDAAREARPLPRASTAAPRRPPRDSWRSDGRSHDDTRSTPTTAPRGVRGISGTRSCTRRRTSSRSSLGYAVPAAPAGRHVAGVRRGPRSSRSCTRSRRRSSSPRPGAVHDARGGRRTDVLGVRHPRTRRRGQGARHAVARQHLDPQPRAIRSSGDTLRVTGLNNGFEGTSVVSLMRGGRSYAVDRRRSAASAADRLYPWTVDHRPVEGAAGHLHPGRAERRRVGARTSPRQPTRASSR